MAGTLDAGTGVHAGIGLLLCSPKLVLMGTCSLKLF